MSPLSRLRNERGAALMIVLIMVVILGLGFGWSGMTWKTIRQREKEEELLWRGDQFRRAIESFVKARQAPTNPNQQGFTPPSPANQAAAAAAYPRSLDDLLKDPGKTGALRHLRKVYKDPVTGDDFVLITAPGGGIKGVRSASKEEPFKKDGFSEVYEPFKDAESYQKWEFVFEPGSKKSRNTTAGGTVQGGADDILTTPGSPGGRPTGGREGPPAFSPESPPFGELPEWMKNQQKPSE